MAADIFTKPFANPQKWLEVIQLISVHPPKGKHPFKSLVAAALLPSPSSLPPLPFNPQHLQCDLSQLLRRMADPGGDPGPDEGGWQQIQGRRWVKTKASPPGVVSPVDPGSGSHSALVVAPELGAQPSGSGSHSAPEGASQGSGSLSAPWGVLRHMVLLLHLLVMMNMGYLSRHLGVIFSVIPFQIQGNCDLSYRAENSGRINASAASPS